MVIQNKTIKAENKNVVAYLENSWNNQLWSLQGKSFINSNKNKDSNDDCEITDQRSNLTKRNNNYHLVSYKT